MGLTVKEAREQAGFSQVDAGRSIGVSEPTYRKYERNPELMPLFQAVSLARVFGVAFMDLYLCAMDETRHE